MISAVTRRSFELFAQGQIDFNRFSRQTHPFWVATARYLLGRWRAPDAVEIEDMVQELLVEAWRAFPKHDPLRGDVTDFVCYEATSKAKRWLHGQRGRRRCSRSDKAPSRHPIRFSAIGASGGVHSRNTSQMDAAIIEFLEGALGVAEANQYDLVEESERREENITIVIRALLSPHFSDEEKRLLRAFVEAQGDLLEACKHAGLPPSALQSMMRVISRVIEERRNQRSLLQSLVAEEEIP